jgi:hypothetical protein
MLVQRWWICSSSLTSSIGDDGSWSKTARGRPSVNVPQRNVPRCMQQACSSTHKASLAMVLSWILQWWRFDDVSFSMRLGGARARQRPLDSVVAGNPRNQFIFLQCSRNCLSLTSWSAWVLRLIIYRQTNRFYRSATYRLVFS